MNAKAKSEQEGKLSHSPYIYFTIFLKICVIYYFLQYHETFQVFPQKLQGTGAAEMAQHLTILGILMPSTHNMANNLQSMETDTCYPLLGSSETRYAQATQTWRHKTKRILTIYLVGEKLGSFLIFKKYTIMNVHVCVHLRVCQTKPHCKPAEVSEPLLRISTFIQPLPRLQGLTQVAGFSRHLPALLSIPPLPALFLVYWDPQFLSVRNSEDSFLSTEAKVDFLLYPIDCMQ